jgi:polyisoprenoid-binding protein YceI
VLCAALLALCALPALSLVACHTSSATRTQPKATARLSTLAAPAASPQFTIDSQRSRVLVLVYRDGPMGRLGHNHVIAVRALTGTVLMASAPEQSSFQLDFPVESMSVDEPQLRAAMGADFDTTVDEAAITGTREHMLGSALLTSKQYPQIHLQSQQIRAVAGALQATTSIQVRDTTAQAQIPVTLQLDGDYLTVSGEFDLTHGQLGLTPYSVALGALRVADRLHVQYRLVAHRQT